MSNLDAFKQALADEIGVTVNPDDPCGFDPLPHERWTPIPSVYHERCYICRDPEYMTHGLPLCFPCDLCGGHVAADDDICDECGATQSREPDYDTIDCQITGVRLVKTDSTWTRPVLCIVSESAPRNTTLCGEWLDDDADFNLGGLLYPTCYGCMREYWQKEQGRADRQSESTE